MLGFNRHTSSRIKCPTENTLSRRTIFSTPSSPVPIRSMCSSNFPRTNRSTRLRPSGDRGGPLPRRKASRGRQCTRDGPNRRVSLSSVAPGLSELPAGLGDQPQPLCREIETAATSVPCCGLIVTDWLCPRVRMSKLAAKPAPHTFATICEPLARPEIFPETPRLVSVQEPESAPPSEMTLLLISRR